MIDLDGFLRTVERLYKLSQKGKHLELQEDIVELRDYALGLREEQRRSARRT